MNNVAIFLAGAKVITAMTILLLAVVCLYFLIRPPKDPQDKQE